MDKISSRILVGQRIRSVREDAGLTRDQLSQKVGISLSTLNRMESGSAPVEIADFINIYEVCGANAKHDFFMLSNPEIMENMQTIVSGKKLPDNKVGYQDAWSKAFSALTELAKTCTLDELLTLNYIVSGEYGGDRYAVLQLFLAYSQLELEKRDMCCGIAINAYEDADAKGTLKNHEVKPNIPYVKRARERAKRAHREQKDNYV